MLNLIGREPWLAAAVVIVAALLAYAVVKKLLKIALFLLLALAALLAWFRITGQDVPDEVDQLARHAGKAAQGAVEKTGELIRKGGQKLDESPTSGD